MDALKLLISFYTQFFGSALSLVVPLLLLVCLVIIIYACIDKNYKKTAYYQITRFPLLSVWSDLGKNGEFHTYLKLRQYEKPGARFLFNIYITKDNGETSEIDVLMLCAKGIFVFESKNYSGWIFGSEDQKNWYQTLPSGRGKSHKEHFFNPVMQNRGHIKYLTEFLGEEIPMYSVIVFSDRCTFKSINMKNADIPVIHRSNVADAVAAILSGIENSLLSEEKQALIYDKLYPCTQVDATVKEKHVEHIQQRQSREVSQTKICPKCSGNMVLRTASKGANTGKQFYGCSNYPKCRYIENIEC